MRAVPGTRKEAVGKPHDMDVLGRLLSEKMIDPIDLRFFECLVSDSVQL